ncbi:hypothetical protein HDV00_007265 [Rhizophlyctis rosea]|nr:hypothetical protein HDV00_007265 [Rhizophlyctis rosea]
MPRKSGINKRPSTPSKPTNNTLPTELWYKILGLLPFHTLTIVRSVSRFFSVLASQIITARLAPIFERLKQATKEEWRSMGGETECAAMLLGKFGMNKGNEQMVTSLVLELRGVDVASGTVEFVPSG